MSTRRRGRMPTPGPCSAINRRAWPADEGSEARELEKALGARDQAVELWTEVYQGVATALSGLYRLAGRKDLADRVRPTSRTLSGEDAASDDGGGGGARARWRIPGRRSVSL